jgi:hypothetical protein
MVVRFTCSIYVIDGKSWATAPWPAPFIAGKNAKSLASWLLMIAEQSQTPPQKYSFLLEYDLSN